MRDTASTRPSLRTPTAHRRRRPSALWALLALALVAACGAGCNFTEDLDEIETEATVERIENEASVLCKEYCDLAGELCTNSNALFDDRSECLQTCATYPTNGFDDEQQGDTVQCRIYHVGVARLDPLLHCPHASPDGGGVCIGPSPCGTYCGFMEENCSDRVDFGGTSFREGCAEACLAYEISGETNPDNLEAGDTFECRAFAASKTPSDPESFCTAAAPDSDVCVDTVENTPCTRYCDIMMDVCTGQNGQGGVFERRVSCLTACAAYPTDGSADAYDGDSIQCRNNHAVAAQNADPIDINNDGTISEDEVGASIILHCAHASPGGGDVCVGEETSGGDDGG